MAGDRARIALFDFGNVLARWSPARLYERLFPSKAAADRFLAEIDWPQWHLRHDMGERFADTSADLIARFPHYRSEILAWFGRWEDMFDGYVPGVQAIIQDLQSAGVPIFGLTNLSHEIADRTFALYPEFKTFKDVIVSGAEKLVKPDPKIYELTLKRIGAPAEQVFFTDDAPANIAAARAMGFKAHVFDSAEGLRSALQHQGLL